MSNPIRNSHSWSTTETSDIILDALGLADKDALLALTTLSDSERWAQWRASLGANGKVTTDRIPLLEDPTELIHRCLLV